MVQVRPRVQTGFDPFGTERECSAAIGPQRNRVSAEEDIGARGDLIGIVKAFMSSFYGFAVQAALMGDISPELLTRG